MSNDIEQIEVSIEDANRAAKEAEDIDALYKNKAFKRIFVEGFFKEFPAVLAQRKANPGMQDDVSQLGIEQSLVAVGQLQQYLFQKRMQGKQMEAQLNELHGLRDAALQADAEGGE